MAPLRRLYNSRKKNISVKCKQKNRFDKKDALELLCHTPMGELMKMAYTQRCKIIPNKYVTFIIDTNPNYTNVCITKCSFCSFYRHHNDDDSYLLTPKQLAIKVKQAESSGATTVLLQGGHNPKVYLKNWMLYLDAIKLECPNIHIHPFSPPEYIFMASQEKVKVEDILYKLWDYGIKTIPGAGAEILVDNIRKNIAGSKINSSKWLSFCETAHKIGFKTTATMMFGHIENDNDIIDHLFKLRRLQDLTGGFTSFIPWSFKPNNNNLAKRIKNPVNPVKYVKIIAIARLILDNFSHIQSSWFSESVESGQLGLLAGANDFGGLLIEENVHKKAGHFKSITLDKIITVIKRAGFIPAQRNSNYNIIKIYD